MIFVTHGIRNQVFFHVTFAVLTHLLPVSIVRIFTTTIAFNDTGLHVGFFNRLGSFPRLIGLGGTELLVDINSSSRISGHMSSRCTIGGIRQSTLSGTHFHYGLAYAHYALILLRILAWD